MRRHARSGPLGFFGSRPEKEGYHHGRLKEALLDAAEALIATRGPAGLSLSEMARMSGVTSAAIYRHYADLQALIGAVARRGFEEFGARLKGAMAAGGPGPGGLRAMGRAYLAFAQERPGAYAAMFSSTIAYSDPDLAAAGQRAFEALLSGVAGVFSAYGLPQDAAFQLALKIWSLSHGVATLAQSGRLSPATGCDPATLLDEGVEALIRMALPTRPLLGDKTS